MTRTEETLREALADVRKALKTMGFSGKGLDFSKRTDDGNTILVNLQKGAKSTRSDVVWTVNYGVRSARIDRVLQGDGSTANVWDAHWRRRLSEGGMENWLTIGATDSVVDARDRLLRAVESVIPDLDAHATDAALRDTWLSGSSPGLVNMKRLLFASILVHELGPMEKLSDIVGELRRSVAGGVHEKLIERELVAAGINLP